MAKIYYARVDEFWRKEEKYAYLDEKQHRGNVEWQEIQPDTKHNWLTEGMHDEFGGFISIGGKEAKSSEKRDVQAVFKNYGRAVATTRDAWVYNFEDKVLVINVKRIIEAYNDDLHKWSRLSDEKTNLDSFVDNNSKDVSWSEGLKNYLRRRITAKFEDSHIRGSLYRPFSRKHLYFDPHFNERRYQMPATVSNGIDRVGKCRHMR